MTRFPGIIWHKLGSIHLTVILCLLLTADLAWGYLCLNRHETLFAPLNDIGLPAWANTYGRHNLGDTAWFFLLLMLLGLLSINTFVCTTDRVVGLVRLRKHFTPKRLFFKFAPHVMHYAMIVILAGYLGSYLFARVLDTRTLVPGTSMILPGTDARIHFASFDPIYYQSDRLPAFQDRVLRPRARLLLRDGGREQEARLSFNQPVRFKGYRIYLKNFTPRMKNGGMNPSPRIDMVVRRDPGVRLYLTGIVLFSAGLAMYLLEWLFFKKTNREIP